MAFKVFKILLLNIIFCSQLASVKTWKKLLIKPVLRQDKSQSMLQSRLLQRQIFSTNFLILSTTWKTRNQCSIRTPTVVMVCKATFTHLNAISCKRMKYIQRGIFSCLSYKGNKYRLTRLQTRDFLLSPSMKQLGTHSKQNR